MSKLGFEAIESIVETIVLPRYAIKKSTSKIYLQAQNAVTEQGLGRYWFLLDDRELRIAFGAVLGLFRDPNNVELLPEGIEGIPNGVHNAILLGVFEMEESISNMTDAMRREFGTVAAKASSPNVLARAVRYIGDTDVGHGAPHHIENPFVMFIFQALTVERLYRVALLSYEYKLQKVRIAEMELEEEKYREDHVYPRQNATKLMETLLVARIPHGQIGFNDLPIEIKREIARIAGK